MVKFLKKFIFKLYVLSLMAFTVWYGYFMYPLIFGFEGKEKAGESLKEMVQGATEEETMFVRLIAEQTKRARIDLGYKVIDQPYIEGRFHHIGFTIQQDDASICVRCHGNVPHDESKEVRSFLNMHAFYLSCETCHSRPEDGAEAWTFRWYDKDTGKIVGNPLALTEIEEMYHTEQEIRQYPVYGNYGAKVAPSLNNLGEVKLLHGDKEMSFVERYVIEQERLKPEQKSQMKRVIHRKVSKEAVQCKDCHNQEDQYIPFAELGYPPTRMRELTNLAVVNMILKYKEFYIPSLLKPGGVEK